MGDYTTDRVLGSTGKTYNAVFTDKTDNATLTQDDFLKLMIEGKEREFVISPDVQRKIDIFNKDEENLQIMRGTMLQLTYEKKDLVFVATDIEIINAN